LADADLRYSIESHIAGDGYRWQYRHYLPPDEPRAHVVGIHGIQSHCGWYEYSCGRLSQAGYTVSFLDRRGSGSNAENRGDAPGFRRLLDDLAEFLRPLRRPKAEGQAGANRQPPIFLMAISWGGKLAVGLQHRHPGLVDGLALLCPGFCPKVKPPVKQRLAIAAARLVAPRKLFPIPLDDPELFTDTPRWQRFIRDDPLSLRQATARFLIDSIRLDGYLRFTTASVRVPVLLLLAGRDRIIDNARTRAFAERFPAADKTIIEYPEAHHTLEFEPEPDRFIDDVLRWLNQRVAAGGQ
jgi:alpha-beta hydrolase superfamily lysophospholipase